MNFSRDEKLNIFFEISDEIVRKINKYVLNIWNIFSHSSNDINRLTTYINNICNRYEIAKNVYMFNIDSINVNLNCIIIISISKITSWTSRHLYMKCFINLLNGFTSEHKPLRKVFYWDYFYPYFFYAVNHITFLYHIIHIIPFISTRIVIWIHTKFVFTFIIYYKRIDPSPLGIHV